VFLFSTWFKIIADCQHKTFIITTGSSSVQQFLGFTFGAAGIKPHRDHYADKEILIPLYTVG